MSLRKAIENATPKDLFPDLTEKDIAYNEGYVAGERAEREKHRMDAELYLKAKARMCKQYQDCEGYLKCGTCGFGFSNNGKQKLCPEFEKLYPTEAVRIVEEWSKEHSIQTNGDKLKEMFREVPMLGVYNALGEKGVFLDIKWLDAPYEPLKGEI